MKQHLIFGIMLVLLSACSEDTFNLAKGGIDGTGTGKGGTNIGPISDFGSIIVNEIIYDTSRAEVFINGEAASFEQLRLGMQVAVNSTQENERDIAEQISYQDNLRGPVAFISPSGNSLRIAEQTVRIDEQTRLHGFERIEQLQVDDYMRVSGATATPNGIQATLLERLPKVSEILITGQIVKLDTTHQTFFIRNSGVLISYQAVQILPANLQEGQVVEVIAIYSGTTTLQANRIRLLEIQRPAPGTAFIFNGTVTRFAGLTDFEVEYQSVRLGANTKINGPLDKIRLGSHLKVSGVVQADGVLMLDSVKVGLVTAVPQAASPMRVSGPLEHIDLQNRNITIFGVPVQLLPNTLLRDISGQFEHFSPQDFRLGERFSVAGSVHLSDGIAAAALFYEPFAPSDIRQLQGPPSDIDSLNGTWHIFGVTVLTNENTQFFDTLDNPPNLPPLGLPLIPPSDRATEATTFFARLNSNILVYASGEALGNALLAETVVLVQPLEE